MLLVALLDIGIAKTGEIWGTTKKLELEQELLFVGAAYRQAIQAYYLNTPSGVKQYPINLAELLEDSRTPNIKRYLRQPYPDPITGKLDWVLIKGLDGRIIGVHSTSTKQPLKQANFTWANRDFADKKKYADWLFAANITVKSM
jgi:type II secretory pathway pseudopilin PulG